MHLFLATGRFPFLITIATIFIGLYFTGILSSIISTLAVIFIIVLGIILTLFISKILSKTLLKGAPSSFILELPPYRKPQISKIIVITIPIALRTLPLDNNIIIANKSVIRTNITKIMKYSNGNTLIKYTNNKTKALTIIKNILKYLPKLNLLFLLFLLIFYDSLYITF